MNKLIAINKPTGLTPNQVIDKVRTLYPELKDQKIGFAGRLDPMARGVLLLLIGAENKERDKYLNLDKTYTASAILGLATDTYDLLGLLTSQIYKTPPTNYQDIILEYIKRNIGKKIQPYPPYSTKPVQGKQLFKWAREGNLDQINIPSKEIEIHSFQLLSLDTLSITELAHYINTTIPKVEGFFRQEEILKTWQHFFETTTQKECIRLNIEVSCSSGTYIRSLMHNLGQELGCGAITTDIYRTKVGNIAIPECLTL